MGTMNGWTTRRRNKSQQEEFIIAKAYNHGAADAGRELTKEIEELRARVKELEGIVPRWVPVAQKISLDIQGWLPLDDQKCGDSERQWLMVPPIPFPEEIA